MKREEVAYEVRVKAMVDEEGSAPYSASTITQAVSGALGDFSQEIERQLLVYHNVDASVRVSLRIPKGGKA